MAHRLAAFGYENSEVVDNKVEAELQLVDGNKVDWKGRSALKYKYGGMKASWLVLAMIGFENLATFSLAVNSVPYFNGIMHYDLADAANMLTNYLGATYLLTIFAAVLADAWIGRYKTGLISGCIMFVGLALLTAQAHYPTLKPPICNVFGTTAHCKTPTRGQEAFLYIGLYSLAFGSAGVKAALPSHGADQFDETDPKEATKMSSFFNILLVAVSMGRAISLTIIVWIENHKGWDYGLGISAISIFLGVIILVVGLPLYRIHVPQGASVHVEIIQVYVAAIRNRHLPLPENAVELYEIEHDKKTAMEIEFLPHRDTFRFLDKAAIQIKSDEQSEKQEVPNPWKLCRVTQVENAKIILNIFPIFCCSIVSTLCLAQLQTFSIQQGYTMDQSFNKHFSIPPASLPIIPIMFLITVVPLYDRYAVPVLRKITGIPTGVTHLQRIGVGLVLSSMSMVVASIIEVKRKGVARDNNMLDASPVSHPLPISIFWLAFQYFTFGIADMFNYVGLLQFFYSELPKGLKSTSSSFLWGSMGLGYFLSTIVVKSVNGATKHITKSGGWLAGNNINRNHLNLFFLFLAIVSSINFCIYLFIAKRYKYRTQGPTTPGGD
ncbi:protein NRT1/ PTR FAMILY 4.5-like [Gastrolobium bilobum]|uniref:protein NRT1/ PTR FAMILY 4.5-like n=1 Tax=Gastrolobium bilobum TaxID=150636 RepID=UPI002AB16931|nr:protein NRT1/ PTR FAMILY 4.5-like [Gastrolobium bilobum]